MQRSARAGFACRPSEGSAPLERASRDMDRGLAALEARRDQTGQLKLDITQALLSGRIRLV